MSDVNSLLAPPEGGKMHFGALKAYASPVKLEAGAAGYTVPGVTDFDGNPKFYKGKVKVEKSRTVHLVLALTKKDREGVPYVMAKDMLTGDKAYKKVVYPSMKTLGDLSFVNANIAKFVQIEEVSTGETFMGTDTEGHPAEFERMAWKIVKAFATEAEMNAVAEEFFSQFAEGDEAAPAVAVPSGYDQAGWLAIRGNVKADIASIGMDATAAKWGIAKDWLNANPI